MNFLEIAKRVRQECGISGDGPAAVTSQTGISAKIINWVQTAHSDVQQAMPAWDFDWQEDSKPLVDGVESYDPESDWGLQLKNFDNDGFYVYRTADGPLAKLWVPLIDWATLRTLRQAGVKGLPIYASQSPNNKLYLYPVPDAGLTAVFEFYQKPKTMAANTDTPRLPERYHMAIVWKAVMYWCAHDENPALWQSANQNYQSILNRMALSELPELPPLEPIA